MYFAVSLKLLQVCILMSTALLVAQLQGVEPYKDKTLGNLFYVEMLVAYCFENYCTSEGYCLSISLKQLREFKLNLQV